MKPITFDQAFIADPIAGQLFARISRRGIRVGQKLGSSKSKKKPYQRVMLNRKWRYAHDILWELCVGPVPEGHVIDHRNGDITDNRLENLRCVTQRQNSRNRTAPEGHVSGVLGVTWHAKRQQWRARIRDNRSVSVHLGWFKNLTDAINARITAELSIGYPADAYRHLAA
jgi:AP2 domain.